ncbi:hypothetical protein [Pseudobacter ginsenosidimutans]|uniref:Uncharacterized protein n=1 Tax=Pseudobacter ginsenosidimutans TaxID=661488 RepID=A0A4Q7MS86_9BACT|nr:hypothetical protein [Pseudobacter ginsenosidimutans]QEC41570.1 hypothetical protein FSB84_07610 [Pseudobacter ginsenosidimutans]RZS71645.1 hypothetical protein EV199_3552 [Pseudobacter ginsenosidimutans]
MASEKTYRPARMLFVDAVIHIKQNAHKQNTDISDSLIASKLNISEAQYRSFYERNFLPEDLFQAFESVFSEFYSIMIVTDVSHEELPDPMDEDESKDGK